MLGLHTFSQDYETTFVCVLLLSHHLGVSVEKVYSPLNPFMRHPFGCPFGTAGLLARFNGSMCVVLNGRVIIGNPWQWDLLVIGICQEFSTPSSCARHCGTLQVS